jgi:hypothetical protein
VLPNFNDPDAPGACFDFSAGQIVYGEEGRKQGDIYLERTFIDGNPDFAISNPTACFMTGPPPVGAHPAGK